MLSRREKRLYQVQAVFAIRPPRAAGTGATFPGMQSPLSLAWLLEASSLLLQVTVAALVRGME